MLIASIKYYIYILNIYYTKIKRYMPRKKKIKENHYRTNLNQLDVPKNILKLVDKFIKGLVEQGSFNRLRVTS